MYLGAKRRYINTLPFLSFSLLLGITVRKLSEQCFSAHRAQQSRRLRRGISSRPTNIGTHGDRHNGRQKLPPDVRDALMCVVASCSERSSSSSIIPPCDDYPSLPARQDSRTVWLYPTMWLLLLCLSMLYLLCCGKSVSCTSIRQVSVTVTHGVSVVRVAGWPVILTGWPSLFHGRICKLTKKNDKTQREQISSEIRISWMLTFSTNCTI